MTDHVYKSVEITGSSEGGIQQSIDNALAKASKTLRNIDWFEVVGIRGGLSDGTTYYQVTLKIGFRLDDRAPRRAPPIAPLRARGHHLLDVLGELGRQRAARSPGRALLVVHALQRRRDAGVAARERVDQRLPAVGERLHPGVGRVGPGGPFEVHLGDQVRPVALGLG